MFVAWVVASPSEMQGTVSVVYKHTFRVVLAMCNVCLEVEQFTDYCSLSTFMVTTVQFLCTSKEQCVASRKRGSLGHVGSVVRRRFRDQHCLGVYARLYFGCMLSHLHN